MRVLRVRGGKGGKAGADGGVGGDTARDDDAEASGRSGERVLQAVGEDIGDGGLEAGGNVGGALLGSAPSPCAATSWATAVFRPEKEKSQPGRCSSGRGRAKALASPCRAKASSAGPPG